MAGRLFETPAIEQPTTTFGQANATMIKYEVYKNEKKNFQLMLLVHYLHILDVSHFMQQKIW